MNHMTALTFIEPPLITIIATLFLTRFILLTKTTSREGILLCTLTIYICGLNAINLSKFILGDNLIFHWFFFLSYPAFIFIIPLCLELTHTVTQTKSRDWLLWTTMVLSIFMTLCMWGYWGDLVLWPGLFFASGIALYCGFHLYEHLKESQHSVIHPIALIIGIPLVVILCGINFFPNIYTATLSVAGIPLILIVYSMIPSLVGERLLALVRKSFFFNVILAAVCIPVLSEVIIALTNLPQANLDTFMKWVTPYGTVCLISLIVCLSMAYQILKRGKPQREAWLFALICILWAMFNLQNALLVIFPVEIAALITLINEIFLVFLIGVMGHLLFVLAGRPDSRMIYVIYGCCLLFQPLIIFQDSVPEIYNYSYGRFIRPKGMVFDFFAIVTSFVLGFGTFFLWRVSRQTQDPVRKNQLNMVLGAVLFCLALFFLSVPSWYGIEFYPLFNLVIIPLAFAAYALFFKHIPSRDVKRVIVGKMIRSIVIFAYLVLAVMTIWVYKDASLVHIVERITRYGIPPLAGFIVCTFMALYAVEVEPNRSEAAIFSAISFIVGALNYDFLMRMILDDPSFVLIAVHEATMVEVAFLLGACIHLSYVVAGREKGTWVIYCAWALGLLFTPFTHTTYMIKGIRSYFWGFCPIPGPLYTTWVFIFSCGLIYAAWVLLDGYLKTGDRQSKDAIKYVGLGATGLTLFSFLNLLPMYGYEMYPVGCFGFFFLVLLAYGLFRHNLMLVFSNLRTPLAQIMQIGLLLVVSLAPQVFLQERDAWAMTLGLLLIIICAKPVNIGVNALFDLFIINTHDELRRKYFGLTQDLSQNHHIEEIENIVGQWLFQNLHASWYLFFFQEKTTGDYSGLTLINPYHVTHADAHLKNIGSDRELVRISADHPLIEMCSHDMLLISQDEMDSLLRQTHPKPWWLTSAELIVPVYFKDQLSSLVIIGNKIDRIYYSQDETSILLDLGLALGPHIENAQLLEGLETEVEHRTQDLNSLLETSMMLHQIEELDKLFDFILKQLHNLFRDLGFGIILEGARPDVIESVAFISIPPEQQQIILENRLNLLKPDINAILRQKMGSTDSAGPDLHWTIFPMNVRGGKTIGKMIIRGAQLTSSSRKVITIFLGQVSAVAQNRILMRELERLANTDSLTGVYNRNYFSQEHLNAISNANRYSIDFSIMMIDVNGLKEVNDVYGHEKGDLMLIEVAQLLRSVCRASDTIARVGGDEFAVLLPSTSMENSEFLANRIRKGEEQLSIICERPDGTEHVIPVRVSLGLSSSERICPEEVMKDADHLMYKDKKSYYASRERYR